MDFTAQSVITSFIQTEKMLDDVLGIIPYSQEHLSVWSPALVTVLLEACSQIESLWKYQVALFAEQSPEIAEKIKDRPNIKDYFGYFGTEVALSWLVFWGGKPTQIAPFESWRKPNTEQRRDKYEPINWWNSYNKIKHDRFSNQNLATLRHAINAVGALLISIIKAEFCREAILQANWVFGNKYDTQTPFRKVFHFDYVAIETTLFSYAVGWERPSMIGVKGKWDGPASYRFRLWFEREYVLE